MEYIRKMTPVGEDAACWIRKTTLTKKHNLLCRNIVDKIYLKWMKVSHLPFDTSVSRLITHRTVFCRRVHVTLDAGVNHNV